MIDHGDCHLWTYEQEWVWDARDRANAPQSDKPAP